jgi:uncharacterized cupredoxin-like copper-binding protein
MMLTPFRLAFAFTLALATPAFAQDAPKEIDVALSNFAFTPDALTLKANTPYRLHLVNSGGSGHNFAAADFFAASTIAPADAGKVKDGGIEVPKGATVDVTVTPGKAGTYELTCTHFMHTTFGMKGEIVVQ